MSDEDQADTPPEEQQQEEVTEAAEMPQEQPPVSDIPVEDDFGNEELPAEATDNVAEEDYYEDDFMEDEDFGEADWENDDLTIDPVADGGTMDEERQRKSKRLNQIIIGGAAVIGLFIFYNTFMSGGTSIETTTAEQQRQQDVIPARVTGVAEQPPQPDPVVVEPVMEGLLHDAAILDQLAQKFSDQEHFVDQEIPMPTPAVTDDGNIRTLIPLPEEIVKQADVTEIAVHDQVSQNSVSSAEISDLNRKMDLLFDRLDFMETELQSVSSATVQGTDSSELQQLKKSLKRLEDKVKDLSQRKVSIKPTPKKTTVKKPLKSTPKQAAVSVSTMNAVAISSGTVRKNVKNNVNWVLRAAQPGEAYVSRTGQQEMFHVSIGDELYGIGRVTGIVKQNNRWVVTGTEGRIAQ